MRGELKAYRVLKARKDDRGLTLEIEENGIDDPNSKEELLLIQMPKYRNRMRVAFFRNQEWHVVGVLKKKKITLWQEDY